MSRTSDSQDLIPGDPPRDKPRAALVTVGGSPAPVIASLNHQKPDFICFFCSPESKELIFSEIVPALNYQPQHFDWLETPDSDSLSACYQAIRDGLPRILRKWNVGWDQVTVDFTGGTKVMSSAAVLATVRDVSHYTYVGAATPEGRTKGGLGVVVNGQERVLHETNPWKDLAEEEHAQLALLFNQAQFAGASAIATRLCELVPEDMKRLYRGAAEAIEGYAAWDRFEYRTALNLLRQRQRDLVPYSARRDDILAQLVAHLEEHLAHLELLASPPTLPRGGAQDQSPASSPPVPSPEIVAYHRRDTLDVIANAKRRAETEQRWDDAVARLYSAIEGIARYRLLDYYGIDTAASRPEQLPESLRADYQRRYARDDDPNTLKFGLQAAYTLLHALGDEVGLRFAEVEEKLGQLLAARNSSRLAHGTAPVCEEVYKKLLQMALTVADLREDELPVFPKLDPER